jgi:hypothetical protein
MGDVMVKKTDLFPIKSAAIPALIPEGLREEESD